jgi:cell division protein FtsN
MAQARRRTKGKGGKRTGSRALLLVLLGIGIGAAVVLLWQLAIRHADPQGGLASLRARLAQPSPEKAREPSKLADTPKTAKPKYDFYIILQEGETLVSERDLARGKAPPAKTAKPEEGVSYFLQAGSFASFEDADQLKARLALAGLVAQIQKVSIEGRGTYHRVRLGPYPKFDDMEQANRQLKSLGIKALASRVRKDTG